MSKFEGARRGAALVVLGVALLAACQDASLPTNLFDSPVPPGPIAVSLSSTLRCDVQVRTGRVECAPPSDLGGSLGEGISADRIIGGQGLFVRMASSGVAYAGTVFSFNATVQNLMTTSMATTDGATRDDAGVRVFVVAAPVTTGGLGTVDVANETATGSFTTGAQPYFQYGGKIAAVDQTELGADGILASGEISSAKAWQFNVPAGVTDFTFTVLVSTETADAGPAASIAPQVTSVSPNPMIPGQPATITGVNFNATPANNTVTIGGRTATVTGGSGTTQLTVTVPCVGTGGVPVQITNLNGADPDLTGASLSHPIQVTQRTVGLGQALVLTSASDIGCNELTATGENTRYIVAVYNSSTTPSNNAPVQISGDVDEGGPPVTLTNRMAADVTALPPALRLAAEQARIADRRHHEILEFSRREYERLRPHFANRPPPQPVDRQMVDPPATRTFRVVDFAAGTCNSYYVVQATLKYFSGKLAIYEDDATPAAFKAALNASMQTYITQIGDQFNDDMEPIVRNNFGDILVRDAVTDNDGLLVALFTPHINNNVPGVAGFVVSCDQFANNDANNPGVGGPYVGSVLDGSGTGASNNGQYFYAYQPTVDGTGYAGNTPDQWYRSIRSTFIHESKHVASQSARVANGAPAFEASWLEEGTARHSEELWMRNAVDNVAWKANTGYGSAASPINVYCDVRTSGVCLTNTRRPATIMYRHFSSLYDHMFSKSNLLSPFGATADDNASYFYAISWSLVRYAIDRYGASDAAFLTALNSSLTSGTTNLAARAGVSIEQLLGGWALALAADDYPGLGAPSADLQMPTWNFRTIYGGLNTDFGSGVFVAYPLIPTEAAFGNFAPVNATTLRGGGVLWYSLSGTQTNAQLIRMLGNGGAALPGTIRLAITRVE